MEVVNFSNKLFHEIQVQDNPAYGSEECIMITKDSQRQALFAVLHIEPVTDPFEDESVTKICECYKLENAIKIAYLLANAT